MNDQPYTLREVVRLFALGMLLAAGGFGVLLAVMLYL